MCTLKELSQKYKGAGVFSNGFNVWCYGEKTREYRDALKADGFRWSPKRQAWYVRAADIFSVALNAAMAAAPAPAGSITPEVIYLPAPAAPIEKKPARPAGPVALLPAPDMSELERKIYKAAFHDAELFEKYCWQLIDIVKGWKGPVNKTFTASVINGMSDPERPYFFRAGFEPYNEKVFYIEFLYSGTYMRDFRFYCSFSIRSKTESLQIEEKAAIAGKIAEQIEDTRKKINKYREIYFNYPELSEKIQLFRYMQKWEYDNYIGNSPAMYELLSRKDNFFDFWKYYCNL